MGSVSKGVAVGVATGLDWKGRPNCPDGFHWDEALFTAKGMLLPLPNEAPTVDVRREPVQERAESVAENSDRRAAIEALAVAMMRVQACGVDMSDAHDEAVALQVAASERLSVMGPVDKAFLALAVINGDAKE